MILSSQKFFSFVLEIFYKESFPDLEVIFSFSMNLPCFEIDLFLLLWYRRHLTKNVGNLKENVN